MRFLAFALPQAEDQLTDYSRQLNIHLTQTTLLLKSSDAQFRETLTVDSTKSSLVLLLVSFITLIAKDDSNETIDKWINAMGEEGSWALEYVHGLLEEIRGKCFRILIRILHLGLLPYGHRLFSVPLVILSCKAFQWKSNRRLLEEAYLDKLCNDTRGKAFEKVIVALVREGSASSDDLHLMLWICKSFGCRLGLDLFIGALRKAEKVELSELVLAYAKSVLDPDQFATLTAFTDDKVDGISDANNDVAIGTLMEVFPDMRVEQCRDLLQRHQGNLDKAIQSYCQPAPSKPKDEFRALLDDKSYMSKVKDQIIAQAYASELEDEDDDSEGESPANAAATAGVEDALMQAYIKDPTVFERSNKVRQSPGRKALCDRLKMTHEQLEGWAIMFSRNVHPN